MTSRPFDPLFNVDGLQRMQRDLGRLFEGDWISNLAESANTTCAGDWRPRADMSQTDDHYLYLVDLPGVELDNIDVSITRGVLRISGKRESNDSTPYTERPSGEFSREFELHADANEEAVSASIKNGVLEIKLSKLAAQTTRQVPVNKGS